VCRISNNREEQGLSLVVAPSGRVECYKSVPIRPRARACGTSPRTVVGMARRTRRVLRDGWFHVTTRGVDGTPIFRDRDDRLVLLGLLATTVRSEAWTCAAVCLMGNHYHLIVHARRVDLSTGMRWLNGVYAQRFNRRYGRRGHLFGDRFASWVVDSDSHLAAAVEYVRQNPVRAGLCRQADDWPWSWVARRWLDDD
jgi:REP element-mobilizing transposase RayT